MIEMCMKINIEMFSKPEKKVKFRTGWRRFSSGKFDRILSTSWKEFRIELGIL